MQNPSSQYGNPLRQFSLEVGNGHTIYGEEWGNPSGIPLLTLHGGPGSSCKPNHRLRFDLDKFRLIMFDRRNVGKSNPLAVEDRKSLQYNSPEYIVSDIECIREYLDIKAWHVCGSSWGATLALLYAIRHHKNVLSLTLHALFLAQKSDWEWMSVGSSLLSPEKYEACQNHVSTKKATDLIGSIAEKILSASDEKVVEVTEAFLDMESSLELLTNNEHVEKKKKSADKIINTGLIYARMMKYHVFDEEWCNTESAKASLKDIPVNVVHGACDTICLLKNVREFKRAHPHAEIRIALNAGHGVDLKGDYESFFQQALNDIA